MTNLWLAMALLLLAAFGFICWPLLPFARRKAAFAGHRQENIDIFRDRLQELEQELEQGNLEQAAFDQLKIELEKSLLQDARGQDDHELAQVSVSAAHWLVAVLLGIVVVGGSLAMYAGLGRSEDLALYLAMRDSGPSQQGGQPMDMAKAIAKLEEKLQQDPHNIEKLLLLAKSYAATGQFNKAGDIYARMATEVEPDSLEFAALKGAQAQSLFQAGGERMSVDVLKLVDQALAVDPQEPLSLMLKGVAAFMVEKYPQAIEIWQQAKIKAGPAQTAQFIDPAIRAARQKMGVAEAGQPSESSGQKATSSAKLEIKLTLAESLRGRVQDDDVVFVFARPAGGRMPLAVERLRVKDLPANIVLDDSKAAMPTAKLSSVDVVDITARISRSGQPMAQAGDLYITLEKVAVKNAPPLAMEIARIVE